MREPDFLLDYVPFWIANYGLAIVVWSCIGRFMLAFFVPRLQPDNYIWRAFHGLTQWAIVAAGFVTPRYVNPFFLPLLAAFWLYALRIAVFLVLWNAGMTPSLVPARGAP